MKVYIDPTSFDMISAKIYAKEIAEAVFDCQIIAMIDDGIRRDLTDAITNVTDSYIKTGIVEYCNCRSKIEVTLNCQTVIEVFRNQYTL